MHFSTIGRRKFFHDLEKLLKPEARPSSAPNEEARERAELAWEAMAEAEAAEFKTRHEIILDDTLTASGRIETIVLKAEYFDVRRVLIRFA